MRKDSFLTMPTPDNTALTYSLIPGFNNSLYLLYSCPDLCLLTFPLAQIAETYAFLPREAVTRFLMNCGECQKRMHINPSTAEFKGY